MTDTDDLRAAFSSLLELYDPAKQDERDSFAIDPEQLADARSHAKPQSRKDAPGVDLDYRQVINLFPLPALARRIFGTLENGRIDRRLRRTYRGLARDLDLIREHLRHRRPKIIDLPPALVPFELLFQVTLLGAALDDAREFYRQVVSELELIVSEYLNDANATVADTLMGTSRVYTLFQSITMDESEQQIEVPISRSRKRKPGRADAESARDRSPTAAARCARTIQCLNAKAKANSTNSTAAKLERRRNAGARTRRGRGRFQL